MTDCLLRPLLKADFPAATALWRHVLAAAGTPDDLGAVEQRFLAVLAAERTVVVAEVAGAVAGFVVVDIAAGSAEAPVADASAPDVAARLAAAAADLTGASGRGPAVVVAA